MKAKAYESIKALCCNSGHISPSAFVKQLESIVAADNLDEGNEWDDDVSYRNNSSLARLLAEHKRGVLSQPDDNGDLPLHHACARRRPLWSGYHRFRI